MSVRDWWEKYAPFWDQFDTAFTFALAGIIVLGQIWRPFPDPTLLAVITAPTAVFGLYELRHSPDKNRPSVKEDFKKSDPNGGGKFGLRNFGPGPAHYLQIVVALEKDWKEDSIGVSIPIKIVSSHDNPIHLAEGEHWDLIRDIDDELIKNLVEVHNSEGAKREGETEFRLSLYYSFDSQSGARIPTNLSPNENREDIISQIYKPTSETRSIELSRLNGVLPEEN